MKELEKSLEKTTVGKTDDNVQNAQESADSKVLKLLLTKDGKIRTGAELIEYVGKNAVETDDTKMRDKRSYQYICDVIDEQVRNCDDDKQKAKLQNTFDGLTAFSHDSEKSREISKKCHFIYSNMMSEEPDGDGIEYLQCGLRGATKRVADLNIVNRIATMMRGCVDDVNVDEAVIDVLNMGIANYQKKHGIKSWDWKPSDVYVSAEVSRQLWHNVMTVDPKTGLPKTVRPSKYTIITLALCLEMSYEQVVHMLKIVGLAFDYSEFDKTLEKCFESETYNVPSINYYLNDTFGRCLYKDTDKKEKDDE
ncbi:MAG: hypothetical protein K2M36_02935 [Clostridia bacterium]|nr:hypothetical protein [Clostridia bacterium]